MTFLSETETKQALRGLPKKDIREAIYGFGKSKVLIRHPSAGYKLILSWHLQLYMRYGWQIVRSR